jgi:hypothetical protein
MELLATLEDKYRLPKGLLNAVMKQESGGNVNAVSPKGARGAFQFMPATAKQYGVDVTSLESSADGAARMYSDLLKMHNGDVDKALASYNWGQGNVARKGMANAPKETRDYIAKIKTGMGEPMAEQEWELVKPVQVASNDNWELVKPAEAKQKTTSGMARFAQGAKDPIDAGAQLLTKVLPQGWVDAGNQANNWLADKTGLVPTIPQGGVDAMIKADAANYQAPEGIDWARLGGNVLSPANLAVASKFPQAASMGGRIASGMAAGGTLGALSPVQNGDFGTEKLKQVSLGAGLGGVLPLLTGGISRAIKPNASSNANVALLKSKDVTPTIGQTLGGFANNAEEKLSSLPIVGNGIANARNKANTQFEKATYNEVLKPIGKALPKELQGRDALQFTETALKDKYDDVLTKIGAIKPDAQFNQSIASLQAKAKTLLLPKDRMNDFNRALNEIKNSQDSNGYLTSEAYKTLESSLGKDAQTLAIAQDVSSNKIAPAVKQLQQELKDMLKRQAGTYADDLQQANSAWAKFKRVQNAASKLGADEGSFTPAQFQNAVRAMDKSKDKAAFARGGALMQNLGDAGKSVLGNKVPNSGTADRALMTGAGIYSLFEPTVGLPLLAGASLYTSPVQKFLTGAVTNRPQSAQAIANAVKQSSPYLTPAFLGLLNQP